MAHEEEVARASTVQARYEQDLLKKAHVVGVGVGLAKKAGQLTQQVCLIVMVDKKVPLSQLAPEDRIPAELDGVCTDVQETGMFTAQ